MTCFLPKELFDLTQCEHRDLFAGDEPAWAALGPRLRAYLEAWTDWNLHCDLAAGVHLLGDRVHIGAGARVEPGAVIVGPAVIGPGALIRTGAYVRENVIIGAGSIVGAHSEVKGAILLPGARAPHQNYVGDSILGRDVNLGAGTICSNVKNIGDEISFRHAGQTVTTGLRKLGAILGDGCKTGCNTVLNPGVVMGPGCITYPNATLRGGYYPPETLVKVRQEQRVVELTRLRKRA